MLPSVDVVLRVATAAVLVVLAGRLLLKHRGEPATVPGALLCAGLVGYLGAPEATAAGCRTPAAFVAVVLAIANAPLIWILAMALFRDQFVPRVSHLLIATLGVGVRVALVYAPLGALAPGDRGAALAEHLLPQAISLGFIVATVVEVERGARQDLVERRRRLRALFVTAIAAYAALVLLVEIALRGEPPPPRIQALHSALLLCAALGAGFLVFGRGGALLGRLREDVATPADPLARELEAWIERQGFLEPDLSIGSLARALRTQEYKLRRLLNGQLGYRNFNEFLHRHRVRVACERLTAPRAAEPSILEISLDVGYSSLATFNRAFKQVTGLSPSDYRAKNAPR